MGNRGFIAPEGGKVGIYLHWNGGRDSVEAFLEYAKLARLAPLGVTEYDRIGLGSLTGLVTVITNFFGNNGGDARLEGFSRANPEQTGATDNGIYVVKGFDIVDRIILSEGPFFEQRSHDTKEMLKAIDAAQPKAARLGEAFLDAVETPVSELRIGDTVFMPNDFGKGRYVARTILGFGAEGKIVNGNRVSGVPYVDMFENQDNSQNPNSYVRSDTIRVQHAGD